MVTLKFSVDAWAVIALRLLIGSPRVPARRPFWVMLTERSGSDFAAAAAPCASGFRPASIRACSDRATVVASRCTCWVAALICSWLTTNASGRPSSRTAVTTTASVDISSRRRTGQPPATQAGQRAARPSVTPLEPKPNPADRCDEAGTVRVVAELAPQPGDMHVQCLGRPPPLAVPDLTHDLLTGDHLPRVADQHAQQVELLGGELKLSVADPCAAGIRIDAHALHNAGLHAAATEQRADPGEKLGQPERLGHVVISTSVEAYDGVHLVRPRGQDQHRRGLPVGAQAAADLEAVQPGQADVEHDQVDPPAESRLQRAGPVRRNVNVVALPAERAGQRLRYGGAIVVAADVGPRS